MNKEFLERLEDEFHQKIQDIRYKYFTLINDLKDPPSDEIALKNKEMYFEIVNSLHIVTSYYLLARDMTRALS